MQGIIRVNFIKKNFKFEEVKVELRVFLINKNDFKEKGLNSEK